MILCFSRMPGFGSLGCGFGTQGFASTSITFFLEPAAATKPNGFYIGGMLRSPNGVLSYVVDHVGAVFTLQRLSFSLQQEIDEGFPFNVKLYPGCDHSRDTCWDKFSNGLNYGGFDFIPVKNPTGGSSIV